MLIRHAITVILCILVFTPQHVCTCHFAFADEKTQNRDTILPPAEPCHCHDHDAFCDASAGPDLDSVDGPNHDCLECDCDQSWVAVEPSTTDPPNLPLDDIGLTPGEFSGVRPCASIWFFEVEPPTTPRYLALLKLRI